MGKLQIWIAARRGRAAQVAAALSVPASFVSKMASGERPVPVAHMARIEELTNGEVSRKDMRPLDWPDIWPELVEEGDAANDPATALAQRQEVAHA